MNRWEVAWFELRRGWLIYLLVALLLAGMIGIYRYQDAFLHARGKPVAARIVSLTTTPGARSRLQGPNVTIVVRAADGLTDSASVQLATIRGCKVGDPISAVRVGNRLRIEPWPCTDEPQ